MTESPPKADRAATGALVTGWIAAALAVAFAVYWGIQLAVLEGGDRFFLLTTLVVFAVAVWVWLALAVASLVLAGRADGGSSRLRTPAYVALAATVVCVVFTLITLFV